MQLKPVILSVGGLVLAGVSLFLSQSLLTPQQSAAAPAQTIIVEQQTVVLIAAGQDIPFGEEISSDKLVSQTWPAGQVPHGAYDSAAKLLGSEGVAPRRATQLIRAGQLILQDNVSDFGENVTITYSLNPDSRAIAIEVSAATAVGGFVSPGDKVDIVLTQGRAETLRTGTILQNIRVLGTDQNADASQSAPREARTITVEVSPREGQILALAEQAGILSLTLRNAEAGDTTVDVEQITMDDIWGVPEPEVVEVPVAAPVIEQRTVTVRRGSATEVVAVQ